MREVREQLWRAGKYAAVGIVVLGTLPVLLPSVFILAVLLFTFALPLVCAIAGFFYLQRHATMLYRYLPGGAGAGAGRSLSTSSTSSASVAPPSSRSAGFTLLELLRKDVDSIDTFEVVDQEFDAVVVSTVSKFARALKDDADRQFPCKKLEAPRAPSDASAESPLTLVDRDDCRAETRARVEDDDDDEQEQEFCNAEDLSVLDEDEHTELMVDSRLVQGADDTEQEKNGDGQFVGTVPKISDTYGVVRDDEEKNPSIIVAFNSGSHVVNGEKERAAVNDLVAVLAGDFDHTFSSADGEKAREHEGVFENRISECEERSGNPDASCTNSGEGVGGKQGVESEKNFNNDASEVYEDKLAAVIEYRLDDLTSEKSCAVHPGVSSPERSVSSLKTVSTSGACRPESAPATYGSLNMLRLDESASDHEYFESTSDASFEAPRSEKEIDFQDKENQHSLKAQSLREVEGFDGEQYDRYNSSLQDEDGYNYEVHSEAPARKDTGEIARTPTTGTREEESCSASSGSEEEAYGPPSTTSHDSDASEETAGMMKGSRSAISFSEDMYDSEEQLHLQQLLQFWRGKEFQACSPVDHAKAQNQHRLRLFRRPPQVRDEEERQLRGELKAIKEVVGDQEASKGPLVSDIEELSQILGIELPSMSDDIPELEWAKVAVEVMKVVVGME
ncbi:hypothetical protein MPTK1_2g03240 [Marchantia polymorpha subsp. ruderalis]|uniref:Uncharacterized protein n=1 Tax=Marchantia polymorpha TaxID=3197 RepID=A0A2R6WMA7_MARPO|nr:hypothetical protein MARPO_0075s0085 [Marchantia polymorpha]PTQ34992.1 hypothetical protein MARPO_0075s0085 [Marchantia polymorpha]BBN00935.1 hypothetical protein Mp_2g03240 [Marchantia polymorpha subsp. ruderalis]BBN00936.1 hypothetical protein Mp_2g03240 [Marchantia polymorpha subsp. ruderalis]|eukprot:PTQ34990.1 hypothetical protein MARPO_0075s0085 [Marchantia polymorpha]